MLKLFLFSAQSVKGNDIDCKSCEISTYKNNTRPTYTHISVKSLKLQLLSYKK